MAEACTYATICDFGGQMLGIAHISFCGQSVFAISTSKQGLCNALQEARLDIDDEFLAEMIMEIEELPLSDHEEEHQLVTGEWAHLIGENFLRLIAMGNVGLLKKDRLHVPKKGLVCNLDDSLKSFCAMFLSETPIIAQIFSKQQSQVLINELERLNLDPSHLRGIEQSITGSELPEESDIPHRLMSGIHARFFLSIATLAAHGLDKTSPKAIRFNEAVDEIIEDGRPWKYNAVNN